MPKKRLKIEPRKRSSLIVHDKPNDSVKDNPEAENDLTGGIYELINNIDKETSKSIVSFYNIKLEAKLDMSPSLASDYKHIVNGISALVTSNPNKLHYDIAEASLKTIDASGDSQGILSKDSTVKDMVCRDLIISLEKLKLRLKKALPKESTNDSPFECDGMFLGDKIYLDILTGLGPNGESTAKECLEITKTRLINYKNNRKSLISFWFNTINETRDTPFHVSLALTILARCIYRDIVKQKVAFKETVVSKWVPAIEAPHHEFLSKLLSPKTTINKTESELKLYHEGKQVSRFPIAAMSNDVAKIVIQGTNLFKKANAFRIVRNFSRQPFYKYANGDSDFRKLQYPGGIKEVAAQSGISGDRSVEEVRQIIHAMAFGYFCDGKHEGNLITLSKDIQPRSNQNPGITIVVGSILIPFGEHFDSLLIPLLAEPSLVSPNQSYAAQYYFHMQISREFSVQSVLFAQKETIYIPETQLQKMAYLAGLKPEVLSKVMDRWTQDNDDGPRMLEKDKDDHYRLGPSLSNEAEFLKRQGLHRIRNSEIGKVSVKKRAMAHCKKKPCKNKS